MTNTPPRIFTGYDRDYLWLMSRTPEVSDEVLDAFKERAEAEGFELEELILVEHGEN